MTEHKPPEMPSLQMQYPKEIWVKRGGHQEADYVNALPIPGHAVHYIRADLAPVERVEDGLDAIIQSLPDNANVGFSQLYDQWNCVIEIDNYAVIKSGLGLTPTAAIQSALKERT